MTTGQLTAGTDAERALRRVRTFTVTHWRINEGTVTTVVTMSSGSVEFE